MEADLSTSGPAFAPGAGQYTKIAGSVVLQWWLHYLIESEITRMWGDVEYIYRDEFRLESVKRDISSSLQ